MSLVWIDCEMTGLSVRDDVILEIGCVITDNNLNVIAESGSQIIHREDSILQAMDPWCKGQHGRSGLVNDVHTSSLTVEDAERNILNFIKQHIEKGRGILAGSSVHFDKEFMRKE